jgi:DNA repair exonuclease SbcCD ATPase subunit
MSHFTVLIKYQGDIAEVEERIAEMLEPYDESKAIEDSIEYETKKKHQYFKEEIDNLEERLLSPLDTSKVKRDEEQLKRARERYEKIKMMTPDQYWEKLTEHYRKDKDGNAVSSCNPEAHWD